MKGENLFVIDDSNTQEIQARTVTSKLVAVAEVLVLAGALLWPAFANGLPLLHPDTGGYVSAAANLFDPVGRPLAYSLFVRGCLAVVPSVWSVAIVQALVTAALVVRVTSLCLPRAPWDARACVLLGVAGISSLPKYVSWIMADLTLSWLWLAFCICVLGKKGTERSVAVAVMAFSMAAHFTQLPLAAACAATALLCWRRGDRSWRQVVLVRGRFVGAALLAGVVSFAALKQLDALHAPPGWGDRTWRFAIGRLHIGGELSDALDRHCPDAPWSLCEHRRLIRANEGSDIWLLWSSDRPRPLINAMNLRNGREHREIALAVFREDWGNYLWNSLRLGYPQLWLSEHRLNRIPPSQVERFPARDREAFMASQQGRSIVRNSLRFVFIRFPNVPVTVDHIIHAKLLLATVIASVLVIRRRSERWSIVFCSALVLQLVNALLVGFGNSPQSRYQGRIAWILFFVLATLVTSNVVSRQQQAKVSSASTRDVVRGSKPQAADASPRKRARSRGWHPGT